MKTSEAIEIISDLASQQWGLVTSAQAKAYGVELPLLRHLVNQKLLIQTWCLLSGSRWNIE